MMMGNMKFMNKKILYIGNSDFAVGPLKALYEEGFDIGLVISQNDKKRSRGRVEPSPVKKYALDNNLNVYTTDDINSAEAMEEIKKVSPNFIIVVSFGQFIGEGLRDAYKDKILNVHASILPKYRGASPIQAALLNGDEETGVSIMFVEEGIDTGDVLHICKLKIKDDHTSLSLSEDLSKLGGICLVEAINNFSSLYERKIKQNDEESSYAGLINKNMGHINFDEDGKTIVNKFRALYAWPKLYFYYNEESVKVHDMDLQARIDGVDNGQIIKANDEGIFVNCSDACLIFKEIQFPNKKRMQVKDYLKGNQIENIILK